ncbi:MAG TPA: hypothetical protein VK402_17330 [Blastococcus sp.]|nr:hypothetical protein [Blastococcus sp.]
MDTGAAGGTASTAPWLVLGFLLGVAVLTLVGLAAWALRNRSRTRPEAAADPDAGVVDDLPGFLESPPGARPRVGPATGWASLSPSPPPAAPAGAAPSGSGTALVLGGMALAALVLLGAAAALAAAGGSSADAPTTTTPSAAALDALDARLAFGGIVLEQRAVGVTAAYPRLEISSDGGNAAAHLELPTFNCLAAEAPEDPVAAGCSRTAPEYADLGSPRLRIERDGDGWAVSGRFRTELHPNGGPAEPTGRAYELRVTVLPAGEQDEEGWRPAEAVLELGPGRAGSVDGEVSVRRSGD